MTPLIAIQVMGLIYKKKMAEMTEESSADDNFTEFINYDGEGDQ